MKQLSVAHQKKGVGVGKRDGFYNNINIMLSYHILIAYELMIAYIHVIFVVGTKKILLQFFLFMGVVGNSSTKNLLVKVKKKFLVILTPHRLCP